MPRIDDRYLECVVYLYPSEEAAQVGARAGGTGFLVSVVLETGMEQPSLAPFLYVVTNLHVVYGCRTPVIRMNDGRGGFVTELTDQSDWTPHPEYAELAVYPLGIAFLMRNGRPAFVAAQEFLTHERVEELDIGPGDEVFFVGRFVTHEGRAQNLPTVRFGNVAMMPIEPVRNEASGIAQESFLVEARSVSGYSGSPVFVYIPSMVSRPSNPTLENRSYGPYLLGVDWGHLGGRDRVRDDSGVPLEDGQHIRQNAAMMTVVPAWKLQELLDQEELVAARNQALSDWLAKLPQESAEDAPSPESQDSSVNSPVDES